MWTDNNHVARITTQRNHKVKYYTLTEKDGNSANSQAHTLRSTLRLEVAFFGFLIFLKAAFVVHSRCLSTSFPFTTISPRKLVSFWLPSVQRALIINSPIATIERHSLTGEKLRCNCVPFQHRATLSFCAAGFGVVHDHHLHPHSFRKLPVPLASSAAKVEATPSPSFNHVSSHRCAPPPYMQLASASSYATPAYLLSRRTSFWQHPPQRRAQITALIIPGFSAQVPPPRIQLATSH